ncbi:MAG: recombinase family protein [Bacteroidota bacterium]
MKCAIYARISVDREGQKSIKEQILQGKDFCNKNGYEPVIFEDKGISGGSDSRPAFNKMMETISSGELDAVFVHNQDRLAREEITWFKLMNSLIENDVKLYEDGREVNLEDESMRMLGGIKAIMDATYRRTTSKKIKNVLTRNASEGLFNGIKNYGYTSKKGVIGIVDSEAIIIRRIFNESESGTGVNKLAKMLRDEGVPTKYNILKKAGRSRKGVLPRLNRWTNERVDQDYFDSNWQASTVNRILHNRIYMGEKVWNGQTYPVPAIISKEQFDRVQELMEKRRYKGKSTEHKYLLQGLIKCGHCENRFTGRGTGNLKSSNLYRCISRRYKANDCESRDINQQWIEHLLWTRLFEEGVMLDSIREYLKKMDDTDIAISQAEAQLKHHEKKIKGWEEKKQKAIELVVEGIVEKSTLKPTLEKYDKELKATNEDIDSIKEDIEYLKGKLKRRGDAIEDLSNIKENAPYNVKKELMDKYIKNIHVRYEEPFHLILVEYYLDIREEIFVIDRRYRLALEGWTGYYLPLSRSKFHRMNEEEIFEEPLAQQMSNVFKEIKPNRFVQFKG